MRPKCYRLFPTLSGLKYLQKLPLSSKSMEATPNVLPFPMCAYFRACPRVMADALGGEVDGETYELSYSASGADVAAALEAVSSVLGNVDATRTTTGKFGRK